MTGEQFAANQKARDERRHQLVSDPSVSLDYYKFATEQMALDERREMLQRIETLELAASCAKDVVDFWPLMTLRTIRVMIPKMETLKQALEMARK